MTVYESGIGDPLLKPESYNFNIRNYLSEEDKILRQVLHRFHSVMELGCSDGRHTDTVIKHEKQYLGIDNVSRYIDVAKAKHTSPSAIFICDDIQHFKKYLPLIDNKVLVVFPFNIIGNLPDAEQVLAETLQSAAGIIIFTYRTDFHTQSVRADYYNSAGFEDITCITNKEGVRFTDNRGLNTIAYSEDWFREVFSEHYHHCHTTNFGNIGVAYSNFNI